MIAIAMVVAYLLSLTGSGLLDFGAPSAQRYLAEAMSQFEKAPVVHEKGVFSRDGHRYEVDLTAAKQGDSQGTVVADGRKVQYRYTAGKSFVLAGQDYWGARGDPRLARFLADKWTTTPEALADFSTPTLGRALSLLDVARPGETFTRKGQATTVNGQRALALSDTMGDLYVSSTRPSRFLRLVSSGSYRTPDGISDVRIDLDYPAALKVEVPEPVVNTSDTATLPAQYVVEPSSFAFIACETSTGCTVGASVRNLRGPQVGDATAEFHLNKEDGADLGTCTAPISPIAHDQTEKVSCTISGRAWVDFSRVGGRYAGKVTVHNTFYD